MKKKFKMHYTKVFTDRISVCDGIIGSCFQCGSRAKIFYFFFRFNVGRHGINVKTVFSDLELVFF